MILCVVDDFMQEEEPAAISMQGALAVNWLLACTDIFNMLHPQIVYQYCKMSFSSETEKTVNLSIFKSGTQ